METKTSKKEKNSKKKSTIDQIEVTHFLTKPSVEILEDEKKFSSPLIIQAKKDSAMFENYLQQDKLYFSNTLSRRKAALKLLNKAIAKSEETGSDSPLIEVYEYLPHFVGSAILNDTRYMPLLQKTHNQIQEGIISVVKTDVVALKAENKALKTNLKNLETDVLALKTENQDLKAQLEATLQQNKEIKEQNLRLDAIAENNFQVASALKAIFLELSQGSPNAKIQKTAEAVSAMKIQHERSILNAQSSLSTNKSKVTDFFTSPKADKLFNRTPTELTHDDSLEGVVDGKSISDPNALVSK